MKLMYLELAKNKYLKRLAKLFTLFKLDIYFKRLVCLSTILFALRNRDALPSFYNFKPQSFYNIFIKNIKSLAIGWNNIWRG